MQTRKPIFHIQNKAFLYAFLIFLTFMCLAPVWVSLVNGTRESADILHNPLVLWPGKAFMDNNKILMQNNMNIWLALWNSVKISVPYTLISVYFCTLAGYGLAKHDFPGRNIAYVFVLATLMVPMQLGFIGYFDLMTKVGLEDTHLSLILPAFHNGAFVFFTKQYIETAVHDELIEAAVMDGASNMKIFHNIVFPIASPAIATMAIFTFVTSWNNLLSPLIMISTGDKQPVPVFISLLRDPLMGQEFGAIYLALGISILPLAIVFLLLSRFIIAGMTQGAVKG